MGKPMRFSLKHLITLNPLTLTIAATLAVVGLFMAEIPLLEMIELKTYDLRLKARTGQQPSPAVVLALIDEKSLDIEGRWPWPRSRIARLVDLLSADGAAVIGFDIGFLEPDENTRLGFIDRLGRQVQDLDIRNEKLDDFIAVSRKHADNDRALAEAIRRSPATVVLGYFFHMNPAALDYQIPPEEIKRQLERIEPSKYPFVLYTDPEVDSASYIQAYAPESNLEMLAQAAESAGYYSVKSDPDGVVRWMPLIIKCGKHIYPPLAVSCVWHYVGKPQMMVEVSRYGVEGIRMGPGFIPTDETGQLLINYIGPPKTFPHISISDILAGRTPKGTFTDRIVLVGATAMGTHDLRSTPVSPLFPGVEIHATVIDNILMQDFMTKPRWSRIYDLMAVVFLGVLTGLALPRMNAVKGVLFASGLFVLHILFAQWLFVHFKVWLNIVYPLLVLALTYTALTVYYYVTEERERKRLKGTFRHYVAPLVIEEMLKDPGQLKLGGEEKVLTVLFSDLEGFTGYSERYAPHQMITFLSEYFAKMSEHIFARWGTLKEYVGDELMAIFGAPLEQPDHAQRACATALDMKQTLKNLREEWSKIGRPPLRARTGINSGPMLVGNLGSKYRFAYGALGDHVNLGSRLEGLNREYGTEILIGENTARLVENDFRLREIDMVRVKGRKGYVRIYELLAAMVDELPPEKQQALSAYAAGLEAYRQQQFDDAQALFEQALNHSADDTASRTMIHRCRIYKQNPPPEDWDCVFKQIHK
jgi:adenylate cyclase